MVSKQEFDIALLNGKVLYKNTIQDRNVYISQGKIIQIKGAELGAEERIDCRGKIIIPGLIDSHVHMREPGFEYKEDFLTGSMAAAHGGVTTFLDMPNTKPPTLSISDLEEKRKLAAKSVVNYGFHFGSSEGNLEDIKKAWSTGNIASVKVFMNLTTGKMMIEDDSRLAEIFDNSRLVSVHAEGDKVKKAMSLCRGKNSKLYLCHISSREEIDSVKKEATRPSVEVTPHHLFLTTADMQDSSREMYPNLKSKEDQHALWMSIKGGIVSTIGSDHAPHTMKEKKEENPPRGVPGIETMLPLLLTAANEGKISIAKIAELCSKNPAKIFRIKNKGLIEKGFDADITIIDLKEEQRLTGDSLFTKCRWTPFEGMRAKGMVSGTIVNGKIVYNGTDIERTAKGKEVVIDAE